MRKTTPLVEMRHVSKAFPGVQALKDVSLAVYGGEVHMLVGQNGAGKSTLIKILCGAYHPDQGEFLSTASPSTSTPHGMPGTSALLSSSRNSRWCRFWISLRTFFWDANFLAVFPAPSIVSACIAKRKRFWINSEWISIRTPAHISSVSPSSR
jgi:energy-coupling factor transporter ATP-binding protein EcfA2